MLHRLDPKRNVHHGATQSGGRKGGRGRERGREEREREHKTISEGQKHSCSKLWLRDLEQEIDGFRGMGVTGRNRDFLGKDRLSNEMPWPSSPCPAIHNHTTEYTGTGIPAHLGQLHKDELRRNDIGQRTIERPNTI